MKKLKLDSAKLKLKKEKIADLTLEDFKNIRGGNNNSRYCETSPAVCQTHIDCPTVEVGCITTNCTMATCSV